MALQRCEDVSPASWLVANDSPDLIDLGPSGFDAYARLRYIRDPEHPGQAEADVDLDDDHPSDVEQARRALHRLAPFTSTPDDCYFCVWDGWQGIDELARRRGPWVVTPVRRFVLVSGALSDFPAGDGLLGVDGFPPAFVWPADRSWCFTSDVDPHWAGIGGSRAAIDALLGATDLDVVAARLGDPQPYYRG